MERSDSDQEAMDTAIDGEGSSAVDQQGSCSAKKGSCSSQKGTKKRKVGSNDATKHAVGYKTKWESDFPWLLSEKNSAGEVIEMLCRLCRRHKTGNKYNKTTVWSETPCVCMLEEVFVGTVTACNIKKLLKRS